MSPPKTLRGRHYVGLSVFRKAGKWEIESPIPPRRSRSRPETPSAASPLFTLHLSLSTGCSGASGQPASPGPESRVGAQGIEFRSNPQILQLQIVSLIGCFKQR